MKIAVLGPGSMGLLYGSKLSGQADVFLVGNNEEHIRLINKNGITVKRGKEMSHYNIRAVVSAADEEPVDLIMLCTKAYVTHDALDACRNLIGKDTCLLTLQNGLGHEDILRDFTDDEHILIGTTTLGSYRVNSYTIVNSGLGETVIGRIGEHNKDNDAKVGQIAEIFEKAGFPCKVTDNIKFIVWNKLMINASSSVLSGVLGKPQGFVAENMYAWDICCDLIRELCDIAGGEGCRFEFAEQAERIKNHLKAAPGGYTSIYSDLQNKRMTEVDYISGAVVRAAHRQGKKVPTHELMVKLVHALEQA
ncbi:MAG: ketopantoate reductase family protein [Solobacterium sp.]|nr:ketopantoate reductase family protein [Solobacterium sp.]